jgi:hypothetical protein
VHVAMTKTEDDNSYLDIKGHCAPNTSGSHRLMLQSSDA